MTAEQQIVKDPKVRVTGWAIYKCQRGHRYESLMKNSEIKVRRCNLCLDQGCDDVPAHFVEMAGPLQRAPQAMLFEPYVEENASRNGVYFETRAKRDEFLAKNNLTYDRKSDIRKDERTAVEDLTFEEVMRNAHDPANTRQQSQEAPVEGGAGEGDPILGHTITV